METFAILLIGIDVLKIAERPAALQWITCAALIGGGVLHTEISLRLERIRRRVVRESANIDLSSVWLFAGAVLLPPSLACAVVISICVYVHVRVRRPAKATLYRGVFSTATYVLSVHAAVAMITYVGGGSADLFQGGFGLLAIATALLAYTVVNSCLVVGVVVISSNKTVREVLGHGDELVLEIATLCLGGLVALAMAAGGPWLAAFALPPLLVLHRAVLVHQLQKAANTDGKTGLLTAAAWHQQGTEHLKRAAEHHSAAGVLILDLDHFKRVNDDYGHLAGDVVLRAVATAIRDEVRDHDLVGRFGGEEFVLLLPHPDSRDYAYADLRATAERIRRAVARLSVEIETPDGPMSIGGLSTSIGGSIFPTDGTQVQDLVAVADTALYAAKRDGRNVVRLGHHQNRQRLPHPTPVRIEGEAPQPT